MITLTAKLDLFSGGNDTLSVSSTNLLGNNISRPLNAILGSKSNGANPFLLGVSKFNDNSVLKSSVDYYIGKVKSNELGVFETPYEFKVTKTSAIKSLTIAFDTYNNRFPKSIEVDGVTYSDDDAYYTVNTETTISLLNDVDKHTIRISNWNAPNTPLVITGIYVDISLDLDYNVLKSVSTTIADRGNFKLPSYGIISNVGSLAFNDITGEVKDYAEQGLLGSGAKVTITLNNTISDTHEVVGTFTTSKDWKYDNNNRSVSVNFKDDLEEWQNIMVEGFGYDPRKPNLILFSKSMANLYMWLREKTPSKYKMVAYYLLDEDTKTILENTIIEYPLLNQATLWQQWEKLAKVCGLYIYKRSDGTTVCSYQYGG
jgi:hypothetical protein